MLFFSKTASRIRFFPCFNHGYDALKKLVVELAAGKQIAEDLPHAQPWVLHTKGMCTEHNDSANGGHFSLLVCQN